MHACRSTLEDPTSGLGRWKNGVFSQFRANEGISDDYLSQIHADADGRLWFAGNKGVFCVREQEFDDQLAGRIAQVRPVVFGRDEGLPALQASREAWPGMVRARDGRLWVCMQTGLAVVHPNAIHDNLPPPIVIESVSVDGEELAVYDAAGDPPALSPTSASPSQRRLELRQMNHAPLVVPAGREQVAIEFAALSFASPRNVAFRFKLEGLESSWVEAGARRVAYYSHLPPGQFRFRVTASNGHGHWSDPGATLTLEVRPHFWQTWWFRALAAFALIGAVAGAVRYVEVRRMRIQVERAERAGAVERERARIAKDIHDDLGASLTEITLLSELAQGGEGQEVQADMRRIAARTRHLTRALDTTVWAVNPRNDTLESLVTYTCNHAADYLQAAGIRCRLEIPEQLPPQAMNAAVRHHVFLIVKEALHNVVKHAAATEVTLRITHHPGHLTLRLDDNGKGFAPNAPSARVSSGGPRPEDHSRPGRSGQGLANMRARAAAIGASFALDSQPNQGTRIQLEIKLP